MSREYLERLKSVVDPMDVEAWRQILVEGLEELRFSLGWDDKRFARYCDVSVSALRRWVSGENQPLWTMRDFVVKKLREKLET